MHETAIFWPMVAHAALVFFLYGLMRVRRTQAVRNGSARVSQFRENREEPSESLSVRNNLANQFELPVLFHAACLALHATGGADPAAVAIAWIFAASRYAHTAVHVTANRIRHRFAAFMVGYLAAALLWVCLAVHLLGYV